MFAFYIQSLTYINIKSNNIRLKLNNKILIYSLVIQVIFLNENMIYLIVTLLLGSIHTLSIPSIFGFVAIDGIGKRIIVTERRGYQFVMKMYAYEEGRIIDQGYLVENALSKSLVKVDVPPRIFNLPFLIFHEQQSFSYPQINKPKLSHDGSKIFYIRSKSVGAGDIYNTKNNLNSNVNNIQRSQSTAISNDAILFGVSTDQLNQYKVQIFTNSLAKITNLMSPNVYCWIDINSSLNIKYSKICGRGFVVIGYENQSDIYDISCNFRYDIFYNDTNIGSTAYKFFSTREIIDEYYLSLIYAVNNQAYSMIELHRRDENGAGNATKAFSSKQVDFSSLKLYSSKNSAMIGFLFDGGHSTTIFRLYNRRQFFENAFKQADLQIIEHGHISSLDMNWDGSIVTYMLQDNARYQLVIRYHQLGSPDTIYPCHTLALMYKYPNYCQLYGFIFVSFSIAIILTVTLLISIVLCCYKWRQHVQQHKLKIKKQQLQRLVKLNGIKSLPSEDTIMGNQPQLEEPGIKRQSRQGNKKMIKLEVKNEEQKQNNIEINQTQINL